MEQSHHCDQSLAKSHICLIDGSGLIFRAYYALPNLTRRSDGAPVGAVAGFCNMIWKLLKKASDDGWELTHIAVIFDCPGETFRDSIYPAYKANRTSPPPDIIPQFDFVRQAVKAFSIKAIEQKGYEGDDLIATYTRIATEQGISTTIIGSDKDLMQLINDNVTLYDPIKNKLISSKEVIEKFGVPPQNVVDVQALAGDCTDNMPGVPGIGVKTAAKLILEHGNLSNLLRNIDSIKRPAWRQLLTENNELALISHKLARLEPYVPLHTPIEELKIQRLNVETVVTFLKAFEFSALEARILRNLDVSSKDFTTSQSLVQPHLNHNTDPGNAAPLLTENNSWTPNQLCERRLSKITKLPFTGVYETLTSSDQLDVWIREANEQGFLAIDIGSSEKKGQEETLTGLAIATQPGKACYIPLECIMHNECNSSPNKLSSDNMQINVNFISLMSDPSILKIGHNLKHTISILAKHQINIIGIDDTMLMSYVLYAGLRQHNTTSLAMDLFNHNSRTHNHTNEHKPQLCKAKNGITVSNLTENADITLRAWLLLKPRLVNNGMLEIYEHLERPMINILFKMEQQGIGVDQKVLTQLSQTFSAKLSKLEKDIHELAGERFNIASPKQVGYIFFEKLKFPYPKKNNKSAWSTSVDVLTGLANSGHELPLLTMEWRHLAKLKSTYTASLPSFINKSTGRIHTSYLLAATTTGRLSSVRPNMQNIPIRSNEGRLIRAAFVARQGHKLISADYDQIELRMLAHIADVKELKEAFASGVDIHSKTAMEVVTPETKTTTQEARRLAKTINFGIIYGISTFGLANQLGLSINEAKDYAHRYFERFPAIQKYVESIKEFCRQHGYVETLFGRRIHFPNINDKKVRVRSYNERAAINAPIQGSASDIMRLAMLKLGPAFKDARLSVNQLLQVHDELIFEAPKEEIDLALPIIQRVMSNAALPLQHLSIPLKVTIRVHSTWT